MKYYFSINLLDSNGIGDRLFAWQDFYLLGRSLGWTYVHQALDSRRSDPDHNIFDFLGVNGLSQQHRLDDAVARHVQVIRCPVTRGTFGVEARSAEDLRVQVMDMVRRRLRAGRLRHFLTLKWRGLWRAHCDQPAALILLDEAAFFKRWRAFFRYHGAFGGSLFLSDGPINTRLRSMGLPAISIGRGGGGARRRPWLPYAGSVGEAARDGVCRELRSAYDAARAQSPWPSKFEQGKVKVLVHVRLGEFGAVRAPWGKFLSADVPGQFERREDIPSRKLYENSFYLSVLEAVRSCTAPQDLSIITASDGYDRTFACIYRWARISGILSAGQVRSLKKMQDSYEAQEFEPLAAVSEIVVGESSDNLYHTLAAFMEADIVISRPVSSMTTAMMNLYRKLDNPQPLHILLCWPVAYSKHNRMLSKGTAKYANILPVDVESPDFDQIKALTREYLQSTGRGQLINGA